MEINPKSFRSGILRISAGAGWQGMGALYTDGASFSIGCFVASRFFGGGSGTAIWIVLPFLWVSGVLGLTRWLKPGAAAFPETPLRASLIATLFSGLALLVVAPGVTGARAAAWVLSVSALGLVNRGLLGLLSRRRGKDSWEGLRLAAVEALGGVAIHPYVRNALLGAGDASSYSLTIADFIRQCRSGIFPVFIGQSPFAFSGGFQPLRNAPYFVHLAGALDLATLHALGAFELQNLAILLSLVGAGVGMYVALRLTGRGSPLLSLGLSLLYVFCPGVLAPLYGGDMVITFMTLPFIPWLVLGMERSRALPERFWPWLLQAAALAALWLSHPPVAAWASILAFMAGLWTILAERRAVPLFRALVAGALFLVLTFYLFVSVRELALPAVSRADALASVGYKLEILRDNFRASLLPVSPKGDHLLGDIQLGYGLWACLAAALAAALGIRSARPLVGAVALLLVFAWPIPGLSAFCWRSLPTEMLVVTNQWPMERFYGLLSALAAFTAFLGFEGLCEKGPGPRKAVAVLLSAACLWSLAESRKFFQRGADITLSQAASEDSHRPENIVVSRTHSYEYLGWPSTFSYGHMDPRLEMRLIDSVSRRPYADGASLRPGLSGPGPGARSFLLTERGDGFLGEEVPVAPGDGLLIRFDFLGQSPRGELQLLARHLYTYYTLPESGRAAAFGSAPGASHELIVGNSSGEEQSLSFRFLGTGFSGALARVEVEPLREGERAIELDSLTPLRAKVRADRDAYLETPKLFVPGYRARVDGTPTAITRSPDGLVALPLSPGSHEVVLDYPGSRLLRASYLLTALGWLALFWGGLAYGLRGKALGQSPGQSEEKSGAWAWTRPRRAVWIRIAVSVGLVLAVGAFLGRKKEATRGSPGAAHLSLRLPWPVLGASEPLITTGHTGAADILYITYVDGRHVRIGHDKWGYGGSVGAPFEVDFEKTQEVDVRMDSLGRGEPRGELSVTWNGKQVLAEKGSTYPARPGEQYFGENPAGGSVALPHFTGTLLQVSRGFAP